MFVNDKIFYHLHALNKKHDELWHVGSSFEIGKGENCFLEYYEDARIGLRFAEGTETIPILKAYYFLDKLKKEITVQAKEVWMQQAHKAIREMGKYIREVIFEEIRKEDFSDIPSRLTGMWLTEKADIDGWLKELGGQKLDIYRVAVTGEIHQGSAEHLNFDALSHRELRKNARAYWSGKGLKNNSINEIIFEGKVNLLEKIDLPTL